MSWTPMSTSQYGNTTQWNTYSTATMGTGTYVSGTDWYSTLPRLPAELYDQKPTIPLGSLLEMWADFQVVLIRTEEKDDKYLQNV